MEQQQRPTPYIIIENVNLSSFEGVPACTGVEMEIKPITKAQRPIMPSRRCIACGDLMSELPGWFNCSDCQAWLTYLEEQEKIRNPHGG